MMAWLSRVARGDGMLLAMRSYVWVIQEVGVDDKVTSGCDVCK